MNLSRSFGPCDMPLSEAMALRPFQANAGWLEAAGLSHSNQRNGVQAVRQTLR